MERKPRPRRLASYDDVLDRVGDARVVLLGEASHGTHEFYRDRAEITRRLIDERGFVAVAAEADWPDAYRVNCFVRGAGDDRAAEEALRSFRRFPAWMWRNEDVLEFVDWLRRRNDAGEGIAAGFYGLDLYSLHASIESVLRYLDDVDPEAAARARARYSCFDHFGDDAQTYGYETGVGGADPCERDVVAQLVELQRRGPPPSPANDDGLVATDRQFHAEQNARLVRNAEQYYRAMYRGRVSSWNLRDTHMAETLDALVAHLERTRGASKVVVWAHNSHLGDARATTMGAHGELNLGQLVRERHGRDAFALGFTTYEGTVTAASDWGGEAECKRVRPALAGSWEELFHGAHEPRFLLDLADVASREARLQRAIGVIYRPETERQSHYFHARIASQFDAVIHVDETTAVGPLDAVEPPVEDEVPETFPTAL